MAEKPIIFSGAMVNAILNGEKTQTRRVIKPQPEFELFTEDDFIAYTIAHGDNYGHYERVANYRVGDSLWVRERHTFIADHFAIRAGVAYADRYVSWLDDDTSKLNGKTVFNVMSPDAWKWRPSIFMPRWASRITLRVTNVRAERLQAISKEDCCAEGIESLELYDNYCSIASSIGDLGEPPVKRAFVDLWNQINEKRGYGWDSNPWVWVYTFEKVDNHTPTMVQ